MQFDVVSWRLKNEYGVECTFENVQVATARWISCEDDKILEEFKRKAFNNLALDGAENLTYIAPTKVNLSVIEERWENVKFLATREH